MIGERIRAQARKRPDKTALTVLAPGGQGLTSWTRGELDRLSRRIQTALAGTAPDEAIILEIAPFPEAVAALIALEVLGRMAVLIPPGLPPFEVEQVMSSSRPGLLLRTSTSDQRALSAGPEREVVPGLHQSARDAGEMAPHMPVSNGSGLLVQITSGSMGASRLAARPFPGVWTEIEAVARRLNLEAHEGGRLLCASSIAHSYGCIGGLLAPLAHGVEVVLAANARSACALMQSTRPAIVVGLASTYRALLDLDAPAMALAPTEIALSAGAPLPEGLYDAVLTRTGVAIRQDYGTTETGTIAIDAGGEASPVTVGTPLAHMEIRIAPPDDQALDTGEAGEIQARSSAVAPWYLTDGRPVPATDADGWFHTRDVGHLDDDGRLVLTRRLRAPIMLTDGPVRPETIEDVIAALPGVRDVVVLPVRGGNRAMKAVVVAPGLEHETVRAWCRERLAAGQTPAVIEMRDELPRSPAGKILHKYMR